MTLDYLFEAVALILYTKSAWLRKETSIDERSEDIFTKVKERQIKETSEQDLFFPQMK